MHATRFWWLTVFILSGAFATGIHDTKSTGAQVPTLQLPWGAYEGHPFADDPNIYLFENVRFGAKPLRFGAPEFPSWTNSSVQSPSDGRDCIQINSSALKKPPGGRRRLGDPNGSDTKTSEDCLFLDLYVPKAVWERQDGQPAPVVVWIYGGAYVFGSKRQYGPLYSGQSIIRESGYQSIFVAGNYRLGAYGWLAGDYMQKAGQPNAGLYDQALLFEWIQTYISQVNGDNTQVSAFGESAGAGSILHHVIREGGTKDPMFSKFAIQSPAFEWSWDNSPNGKLDKVFKNFSNLAGCGQSFDIDCLRESKNLSAANQALFETVRQTGLFPVGPAVDGDWVKTLPTISLSNNHFWKGITSTIISHCQNEAESFTPKNIRSKEDFNAFLALFLPGDNLENQREKIRQQYDCEGAFGGNWKACLATIIRDASFTCNTRDLFTAYPKKSYMMSYGYPSLQWAYHASDLVALFSNTYEEAVQLLIRAGLDSNQAKLYAKPLINTNVSAAYQTYFASFVLSGDPNGLDLPPVSHGPAPAWAIADGSNDNLENVLQVQIPSGQAPFVLIADDQNSKSRCYFWTSLANEIASSQNSEDHISKKHNEL